MTPEQRTAMLQYQTLQARRVLDELLLEFDATKPEQSPRFKHLAERRALLEIDIHNFTESS